MKIMLAILGSVGYTMAYEQAPYRHPRPNPLHALRGVVHAVDLPRVRRVDQLCLEALGRRWLGMRDLP